MPSCSKDHETVRWEGIDPCWFCGDRPRLPVEIPDEDEPEFYGYGAFG